jgi:hypothetical protein
MVSEAWYEAFSLKLDSFKAGNRSIAGASEAGLEEPGRSAAICNFFRLLLIDRLANRPFRVRV